MNCLQLKVLPCDLRQCLSKAHTPVWNPPQRPHATKVGAVPFLCLYAWTSDVAEPALIVEADDWPRLDRVARYSELVVFSDFLADAETTRERLRALAARGAGMHLLQVFDPAEEVFPYEGRLEFREPESGVTWLTERAGGADPSRAAR